MSAPRVAVIVLTKDGAEHLAPGLDALFSCRTPRGGLEVVLVDNGSTDGGVESARRRFPALRVLRSERNLGFARGVQLGAAGTAADVLVFINDDAVAAADAVEALVEALDTAPKEAIAAAGMLTDASGTRVDFIEGVVTFDGHALQRGAGRLLSDVDPGRRGDPRLFPCGGLCAVKRRDFELLGGFDGDFFAYLEDVDFGWRASLAGRTTIFVPDARARHISGATGRRLGLAMRGVLFETNAFAVAYKNLGDRALKALLPAILATFQHRALYGILDHQTGAEEALADPFGAPPLRTSKRFEPPPPVPASVRQEAARLVSRLSGIHESKPVLKPMAPGAALVLEDEYARMWLVAWNRIVSSWGYLQGKRRHVQSLRRVCDEELLSRYPLHIVPTYPGDAELFASDLFQSLLPEEPRLVPTTLEEVAGS